MAMKNGLQLLGADKGAKTEIVTTELGNLWTHLLHQGVSERYRSIGFCSIGSDEAGKAMAARLAMFLGNRGKRIALLEAALRAPLLADAFDVTSTPGLAEMLSGQAGLRDVLRTRVSAGVDMIPAGRAGDAFWSFTNDRFQELQQELLLDRDLVFVDFPAPHRAPEASLVVGAVDAVVLVVEAGQHRSDVVRRSVASLRALGTPFLGAMLTDVVYDLPGPLARIL
jgi:succinoglycan biosynthesis transport protein ExoP